jgi:hypothetical protein
MTPVPSGNFLYKLRTRVAKGSVPKFARILWRTSLAAFSIGIGMSMGYATVILPEPQEQSGHAAPTWLLEVGLAWIGIGVICLAMSVTVAVRDVQDDSKERRRRLQPPWQRRLYIVAPMEAALVVVFLASPPSSPRWHVGVIAVLIGTLTLARDHQSACAESTSERNG